MLLIDRKIFYISRFDHWLSNEECDSRLLSFFDIKNKNDLKEYLKIEKKIIHFFSQYFYKSHFELIILNTPAYPRLFSKKYYSLRMEQIKHFLYISDKTFHTKGKLIISNKRDFLNIIKLALRYQLIYDDLGEFIINKNDKIYGVLYDYLDFKIRFFDRGRARYFLKRNNLFILDKFYHNYRAESKFDMIKHQIDMKKKILLAKKRICKLS